MCSIWNASLLAPEERVTPDGYHVWNWNPRGTGSEKKQARHTGRLAEHLTYLPRGQDKTSVQERQAGKQRKSEHRIYHNSGRPGPGVPEGQGLSRGRRTHQNRKVWD